MQRWAWLLLLALVLAACSAQVEREQSGPRLVAERTLQPTDALPTRIITATPTRGVTPEIDSPLERVTVDAQFVVITPTLPPSKTPTPTQTPSPTPTQTQTPTTTVTGTATAFLLPTSDIVPVTEAVAVPNNLVCETNWVDIEPRPESCPLAAPNASPGTFQTFENGYMIHVANQDAIYVLYTDVQSPRWQVFRDYFSETASYAERLDAEAQQVAPGRWTARRGFGLVWENEPGVQSRLGYATEKWEERFSLQVQTTRDGAVLVAGQNMNIALGDGTPATIAFGLMPEGLNWNTYAYNGATLANNDDSGTGEFQLIEPQN
jgi:hypothetical protein